MQKKELRKIYKQKRKELTSEAIEYLQHDVYQQVYKYDFSKVATVHIFLPIKKQKEINTYPIINFLRSKGKKIIISKSDFKTNTLQHYLYEVDTVLSYNVYGIPEPVTAKQVKVQEIDLVFVPLLISDKKQYRVGYGKGFYDRFLAACKKTVITIGINFFAPITKVEDCNEFDMPLNQVIYPTKLV